MARLQRLLLLCTHNPDPHAPICAWSRFDPDKGPAVGQEDKAPYDSVMAAIRDGWRVIRFPAPIPAYPGMELDTSYLKNEFVLERIEEFAHV
jgi:hypothetical protein